MVQENVKFIKQIRDKDNMLINVFYYRGWFLELPMTTQNFYNENQHIADFKKEIDDLYDKYKSVSPLYNQISFDDIDK